MKKPSLFDRLFGAPGSDRYDEQEDDYFADDYEGGGSADPEDTEAASWEEGAAEESAEGELPLDMYNTPDAIVIRTLVAGVDPDNLDIDITRDMVTVRGRREEVQECSDDDYYHRELFWGSFSRTVMLPDEVVIDEAEAREKHGYLEVVLPKVDKDRSTRLNVKSGK